MYVYRKKLCVWLLLLAGSHTFAQQPPEPWTKREFPPARGNYEYRLAYGSNEKMAIQSFQLDLSRELGCDIESRTVGHQFQDQGKGGRNENQQFTGFSVDCESGKIWAYRVKDYRNEKGQVFILYEISKTGDFKPYYPVYKWVNDYDKSRAVALSFVPFGAAQFYKGNKGMGTFFLTGEALALVGAGMSWHISGNYYGDYRKESDPLQRVEYKRLSQDYEKVCIISLYVAGGFYVGSLLHGIFMDGKRKKYQLAMTPYMATYGNGLAVSYKF